MALPILFTAVFSLAILLVFRRAAKGAKAQKSSRFVLMAAALFLAAFALRLYMGYFAQGFTVDIDTFKGWAGELGRVGFSGIYREEGLFLDYPPGYLYVLWLLEKLRGAMALPASSELFTLLIKLPAIFSDMLIAAGLLWGGRRRLGEPMALALSGAYLFCPAVLINSARWGQVDSVCTLLLLLSVLCLYRDRYLPSALLYGLSLACKPQMLIFAPLYIFFALKERRFIKLLWGMPVALLTVLVLALPFSGGFDILWLWDIYRSTMDFYAYYSVNAYNLWALLGLNWSPLPDGALLSVLELLAPVAATALCGVFLFRSRKREAVFACPALLMGVMYLLGVKMHERYLYPAFLFLLAAFLFLPDRRLPPVFAAVTGANYLNVSHVLYLYRTVEFNYDPNALTARALSGVQVLALLLGLTALFVVYLDLPLPRSFSRASAPPAPSTPMAFSSARWRRGDTFAMLAVTVFYALFAFHALGDRTMPKSLWAPAQGEQVLLTAEEPVNEIAFLPALAPDANHYAARTGAAVRVEVSADGVTYVDCGLLSQSGDAVYAWARHPLSMAGRYVRLTAEDGASVLGEVGLRQTGRYVFAAVSCSPGGEALLDEPDTVPLYTTYLNSTCFDEIYHARTAYEHILGLEPYENTHPPLGKYLISLGILLFGMDPFGWRFMGTLTGVLMLPVFYRLLRRFFDRTALCAMATLWFAFDFMHFTQTRIATIDTYAVFFLLLMYDAMAAFLREDLCAAPLKRLLLPLGLCGVFTGLGIAAKWTAAYGALGLGVLFFGKLIFAYRAAEDRSVCLSRALRLCGWCCVFFLLIPFALYFAAFLPITCLPHNVGDIWGTFWRCQVHMYRYHSGLVAEHFFASPWYEWPLDIRPIWFFSGDPGGGKYSTISSFGSPLLWWAGLLGLFGAGAAWFRRKAPFAALALCGFLAVFLPWTLVPRLTFIYHYFTAVPFMTLALAGCGALFSASSPGKKVLRAGQLAVSLSDVLLFAFTGALFVSFLIFYPVLSGIPVAKSYTDALRLLPTWYF